MSARVDHIAGHTYHGRKGAVANAFRYGIDYVLLNAEATAPRAPRLFSRNRGNLLSLHDRDHGGAPGEGAGARWVRDVLVRHQLPSPARIDLLAQPRVLGHVFNPVSFWLCHKADGALYAVIAEVSNTYGERHSYLCHQPDAAAISAQDDLHATKVFHVSPFQPVEGDYHFRFDIRDDHIGVRIEYRRENGGLIATLTGTRKPLTMLGALAMMLRRPFGSRRVLALIHWQALKLWWKGAKFRHLPSPPNSDVSRG